MSRIGNKAIVVPAGVTVDINDNVVTVKGAKGELSRPINKEMIIKLEASVVTVERPSDNKIHKSMHGLSRTLIANMITGVSAGYAKTLEIAGVGYRVAKTGDNLSLTLGFSHPVVVEPPPGINFDVPAPNRIVVSGINKETVGAVAAQIRTLRKPEPYKGKGIKYEGEHIRRKAGKTGAKGKK